MMKLTSQILRMADVDALEIYEERTCTWYLDSSTSWFCWIFISFLVFLGQAASFHRKVRRLEVSTIICVLWTKFCGRNFASELDQVNIENSISKHNLNSLSKHHTEVYLSLFKYLSRPARIVLIEL